MSTRILRSQAARRRSKSADAASRIPLPATASPPPLLDTDTEEVLEAMMSRPTSPRHNSPIQGQEGEDTHMTDARMIPSPDADDNVVDASHIMTDAAELNIVTATDTDHQAAMGSPPIDVNRTFTFQVPSQLNSEYDSNFPPLDTPHRNREHIPTASSTPRIHHRHSSVHRTHSDRTHSHDSHRSRPNSENKWIPLFEDHEQGRTKSMSPTRSDRALQRASRRVPSYNSLKRTKLEHPLPSVARATTSNTLELSNSFTHLTVEDLETEPQVVAEGAEYERVIASAYAGLTSSQRAQFAYRAATFQEQQNVPDSSVTRSRIDMLTAASAIKNSDSENPPDAVHHYIDSTLPTGFQRPDLATELSNSKHESESNLTFMNLSRHDAELNVKPVKISKSKKSHISRNKRRSRAAQGRLPTMRELRDSTPGIALLPSHPPLRKRSAAEEVRPANFFTDDTGYDSMPPLADVNSASEDEDTFRINKPKRAHRGRRGHPDSSDPSSSDSSTASSITDSSSSPGESSSHKTSHKRKSGRRGRKQKKSRSKKPRKSARSTSKITPIAKASIGRPPRYDGSPNIEQYEQWTFEMTSWFDLTGVPNNQRLQFMASSLSGKAKKFFMTSVSRQMHKWTVRSFGNALYEHCFPTDLRHSERLKFQSLRQGSEPLTDFVANLRNVAARVPGLEERAIVLQLYDNARHDLQEFWAKEGYDPEFSSLDDLLITGQRFEKAQNRLRDLHHGYRRNNERSSQYNRQRLRERLRNEDRAYKRDRNYGYTPSSMNTPSASRDPPTRPYSNLPRSSQQMNRPSNPNWRDNNNHTRNNNSYQGSRPNNQNRQDTTRSSNGQNPRLQRQPTDEQRARNQCPVCTVVGHLARDCPLRNTARPPSKFRATSIALPQVKTLASNSSPMKSHGSRFRAPSSDSSDNDDIAPSARSYNLPDDIEAIALLNEFGHNRQYMAWLCEELGMLMPDFALQRAAHPRNLLTRFTWSVDDANTAHVQLHDSLTGLTHLAEYVTLRAIDINEIRDFLVIETLTHIDLVDYNYPPLPFPGGFQLEPEHVGGDEESTPELKTSPLSPEILPTSFAPYQGTSTYSPTIYDHIRNTQTIPQDTVDAWAASSSFDAHYADVTSLLSGMESPHGDSTVLPPQPWEGAPSTARWRWVSYADSNNEPNPSTVGYSGPPLNEHPIHWPTRPPLQFIPNPDPLYVSVYPSPGPSTQPVSYDSYKKARYNELHSKVEALSARFAEAAALDLEQGGESNWLRVEESPENVELWNMMQEDEWSDDDLFEHSEGQPFHSMRANYSSHFKEPASSNQTSTMAPTKIKKLQNPLARPRDAQRLVPKTLVIRAHINGREVRALLDSGSHGDFISTRLADQLSLPLTTLPKTLTCQLAAQGSKSMIQYSTTVNFECHNINEQRCFDVLNLDTYDVVLGTPFFFQHSVVMGFNPCRLAIGSLPAKPIEGEEVARIACLMAQYSDDLDNIRESLRQKASHLCKDVSQTPLPPLRAINHRIDLIDEDKIYKWRPSRCPEPVRHLWTEKKNAYLSSGRWQFRPGRNAVPMLIVHKKPGPGGEPRIRTVFDKREMNMNTVKQVSPLPNMDSILSDVLKHPYRSLIDGRDAYKQIRIVPEHVERTLFNTPDGTMISLVLQQGDTNGPATYQALMNHIFGPYIGVFLHVYLDDIIIFSDSIEEHIQHIEIVLDILEAEKLYLSTPDKLQFFARRLEILGHIIDDKGLTMDPHKVDTVVNWKNPSNKDLLAGFLGAVGYLAPNCKGIRVPMGLLARLTGSTSEWNWTEVEQRAFEQIKNIVELHRTHHRVSLDYSSSEPINLICDASLTGAGGHISQGSNIHKAPVVAFYSAKFTAAQQNYPVHEREMLAIVESLKRFRHLLQGVQFRIFTDHKPLQFLNTQQHFSARQYRWMDVLNDFTFSIHYVPGENNTMADALSRIYSVPTSNSFPSEYIVDSDESLKSSKTSLYQTQNIPSGNRDSVQLAAARFPTDAPDRVTRSATKSLPKPRDRNDAFNVAVLPATDAARDALTARRKPKRRAPQPLAPPQPRNIIPSRAADARKRTKQPPGAELPPLIPINDKGPLPPIGYTSSTHPPRPAGTPHYPPVLSHNDINSDLDYESPPEKTTLRDRELLADPLLYPSTVKFIPRERLTDIISSYKPEIDFPECIRNQYHLDKFFGTITTSPEHHPSFEIARGFILKTLDSGIALCIPDILVGPRRLREYLIDHAHTVLSHLGSPKTLEYIRQSFWWPKMADEIKVFCSSCNLCQQSKTLNKRPFGLLKTLSVPTVPWESIGVDFIGPLPNSTNRNGIYDMITLIVDHLTGMVHLAPSKSTYKSKDVAELIFETVYKLHGLPERIVSDRDSLFGSGFWIHMNRLVGINLRKSTAFHPESDGSSERAVRTIGQMLRHSVADSQKDWASKLPAIEFALNSAVSATTGYSPFFLNYGRRPSAMVWNSHETEFAGVRTWAENIQEAIVSAHDNILMSRVKQTTKANRRRRPSPFKLGDLVYLSTENINLPRGNARKFAAKFIGPFKIVQVIVPQTTFKLDLSNDLKARGIHPVFHSSLLRPHIPSDDRRFPARRFAHISGLGASDQWIIKRIVSHMGQSKRSIFEVEWSTGDTSWITFKDVSNTQALDNYLELLGAHSIQALPLGTCLPPTMPTLNTFTLHLHDPLNSSMDWTIENNQVVNSGSPRNYPIMPPDKSRNSSRPYDDRECRDYNWGLTQFNRGEGPDPGPSPSFFNLWRDHRDARASTNPYRTAHRGDPATPNTGNSFNNNRGSADAHITPLANSPTFTASTRDGTPAGHAEVSLDAYARIMKAASEAAVRGMQPQPTPRFSPYRGRGSVRGRGTHRSRSWYNPDSYKQANNRHWDDSYRSDSSSRSRSRSRRSRSHSPPRSLPTLPEDLRMTTPPPSQLNNWSTQSHNLVDVTSTPRASTNASTASSSHSGSTNSGINPALLSPRPTPITFSLNATSVFADDIVQRPQDPFADMVSVGDVLLSEGFGKSTLSGSHTPASDSGISDLFFTSKPNAIDNSSDEEEIIGKGKGKDRAV